MPPCWQCLRWTHPPTHTRHPCLRSLLARAGRGVRCSHHWQRHGRAVHSCAAGGKGGAHGGAGEVSGRVQPLLHGWLAVGNARRGPWTRRWLVLCIQHAQSLAPSIHRAIMHWPCRIPRVPPAPTLDGNAHGGALWPNARGSALHPRSNAWPPPPGRLKPHVETCPGDRPAPPGPLLLQTPLPGTSSQAAARATSSARATPLTWGRR